MNVVTLDSAAASAAAVVCAQADVIIVNALPLITPCGIIIHVIEFTIVANITSNSGGSSSCHESFVVTNVALVVVDVADVFHAAELVAE